MKFGTTHPGSARERALVIAERHVESEYSNVISQILPTVSKKDTFFPIVYRMPGGSFGIDLYEGETGPQRFYERRGTEMYLETSDNLSLFVGDWFTVRHSVGTVVLKDGMGSERAGKRVMSPTVIVFPIADDGIIGEMPWSKYDIDECIRLTAAGSSFPDVNASPIEAAHLVGNFAQAWREADKERLDALLGPECFRVTRVVDSSYRELASEAETDRAIVLAALAEGCPGEMNVISQHVQGWCAVVEYMFVQQDTIRRSVSVYPIEDGRILGEMSYSIDS